MADLKQSVVTVTNATDVTEEGYAMDARQNNAANIGSLRYLIENAIKFVDGGIELSDGEKIQWGSGITSGSTNPVADIKFGTDFTTHPHIIATPILHNSNHHATVQISNARNDGFYAWAFYDGALQSVANIKFCWLAVGK